MTQLDKLIERFLRRPKDFKYNELSSILNSFGYVEIKRGKTGGSRRAFIRPKTGHIIRLHEPQQKDILKMYQIEYLIEELKKENLI